MKIYSMKQNRTLKKIKVLGLTVYKREIIGSWRTQIFLKGLLKIRRDAFYKKIYLCGIQVFNKHNKMRRLEKLISDKVNHLEAVMLRESKFKDRFVINEIRKGVVASQEHQKLFPRFKDIHKNDSLVIVGCGPTLSYYEPLTFSNMKYISLNRAFTYEKVHFDYIFSADYLGIKDYVDALLNYDNCIKFFGRYLNLSVITERNIPEKLINDANAYKFYTDNLIVITDEDISPDISSVPLVDFYSIATIALHFAFWTHPQRIYLVGCDCQATGYFDGTSQRDSLDVLNNVFNTTKRGYLKFKKFRDKYYPDIDVISINPVGLRGVFKDVYTKKYLEVHPDLVNEVCENSVI